MPRGKKQRPDSFGPPTDLLFIYFPLGAWVSPGLNNALSSHEETEREREKEIKV